MDLVAHVSRFFIENGANLALQSPLLVALSGGPDSLVLLHLLAVAGAGPPGQSLHAAHLDHALRPESSEEAAEVAARAEAWGVPCTVERVDVAALARHANLTVEEGGRRARYAFFQRLAAELDANAVAVAHNADDQVETVLHHFIRGSGLAGLRGMAPVTRLAPMEKGRTPLLLLRPLLDVPRTTILDYAAAHHLEPLHDPSNEELVYTRNRIRHELLPMLEQFNPAIREQVRQNAAIIVSDDSYLAEQATAAWSRLVREEGEGWLRVDLAGWRALPLALQRRTLRLALCWLYGSLSNAGFRAVEQARKVAAEGAAGAQAVLPGGISLSIGYDNWLLALPDVAPPIDLPQLPVEEPLPLPVPGSVILENGWELLAEQLEARPEDMASADRWTAHFDAGQLEGRQLWLRPRLPGERFQPLGMDGRHARVKEVVINSRLAARLRRRWPIVATEEHLLWLVGHHLDRRAAVTPETAAVIRLRCRRVLPSDGETLTADH
jgi:tRNA(Ile)-lysidine synthase